MEGKGLTQEAPVICEQANRMMNCIITALNGAEFPPAAAAEVVAVIANQRPALLDDMIAHFYEHTEQSRCVSDGEALVRYIVEGLNEGEYDTTATA